MGCLVFLGGFDNALEMFRPFGPGERGWILAVFLQVPQQEILQVLLGALHAVAECLPGENAEEALNHIHPRGVRCGVVKMHTRMAQKPLFGGFVLMNVEIVKNDVKFANRIGSHDIVHET
jgi:hypothetical protein